MHSGGLSQYAGLVSHWEHRWLRSAIRGQDETSSAQSFEQPIVDFMSCWDKLRALPNHQDILLT